jgi:S-DNA-T family DNA segregation ATPase FtsK/SpoIIIE
MKVVRVEGTEATHACRQDAHQAPLEERVALHRQVEAQAARPRAEKSSPKIEQRHLDLLGLALIVVAVFLGFILYSDRDGGEAGRTLVDGLTWLGGDMAFGVPIALAAIGAILVLRPVLPRSGRSAPAASASRSPSPCGSARRTAADRRAARGQPLDAHRRLRRRPARDLPVHRGGAAAHGRLGRRRAAGDAHERHRHDPRDPHVAPKRTPAPRRRTPIVPPEPEDSEPIVRAGSVSIDHDDAPLWEPLPEPDEPPSGSSTRSRRTPARSRCPRGQSPPADDDETADESLPWDPEEGGQSPAAEGGTVPEDPDDPETAAEVAAATRHVEVGPDDLTPQGRYRASITDDPEFEWTIPGPGVLKRSTAEQARPDTAGQAQTAKNLVEALGHFGIEGRVIGTVAGPHITRYELRLGAGVKMSKVSNLKDDLAYALAATDIRILAPIPGKTAVGVEVPNQRRKIVQLGDVFAPRPDDWSPLTVWLGKDVAGKAVGADLAKMPHILVAGTTGAGKSACVNAMLSSVLLNASPHEVKLVLFDPKQVELNHYEGIPHLLTPVITSPRMAANALQNLVKEMEAPLRHDVAGQDAQPARAQPLPASAASSRCPYILCVIDELADLMMVAPADVEDSIIRLGQKARAVGIHLVLATQSPRVDVITGMIKANVPSRIAFAVSSQTDSRVILDQNGAESLLGKGDMLFSPVGSSEAPAHPGRVHRRAADRAITDFWRAQASPRCARTCWRRSETSRRRQASRSRTTSTPTRTAARGGDPPRRRDGHRVDARCSSGGCAWLHPRRRLIDMLERRGVISGYEGSKPRQVLVQPGRRAPVRRDAGRGSMPRAEVPCPATE